AAPARYRPASACISSLGVHKTQLDDQQHKSIEVSEDERDHNLKMTYPFTGSIVKQMNVGTIYANDPPRKSLVNAVDN
ncbi:hypothetical protein H0H92_002521, partial [Tricholoma furcatifolium]